MNHTVFLAPLSQFSPVHTFECGQCFRWTQQPDGCYIGVAGKDAARVFVADDNVFLASSRPDEARWRAYFDLDRDYAAVTDGLPLDRFTRQAVEFGRGLRILRQDPWEALCSFLLSQCNHIARIRRLVSELCRAFGEPVDFAEQRFFTFPTPERVALLDTHDLAPLRAGYRAAYLPAAARAVCSGEISFPALAALPTPEARRIVMTLPGVGPKVADCFLLFGLARMDAFPVDTWMKKAAAYYPDGLSADRFGPCAGIVQQYIFYYARTMGRAHKELSFENTPV